ncbi:hypothetical protein TrVFT333_005356 [Trichoderma virens FT-333]|nr:hypothetical protein TrVFT333_005356 [Trichoderma virens FT-333]
MSETHHIGQRISYDGATCTVRFVGGVAGTTGSWLGVEWDDAARGKHDGSHKGTRYFTCTSKSPTAASFVRPTRPADAPQSFLAALNERYVVDAPGAVKGKSKTEIVISGKVAQEMGFDKIWRRQSRLRETKIVILDGLRVAVARTEGDVNDEGVAATIAETAPKIVELDLSRNLFEQFGPVVDICRDLKDLQKLSINLATLNKLRHLQLKGNNISAITSDSGPIDVVFPPSVQYVDLSYNKIDSWEFVDKLPTVFPGMIGLRITHNPIYYSMDAESNAQSSDESFMFTVARIAQLKTLNFTHITTTDRTNAEMFYLSRIAKQLATVPEAAEDSIKVLHPRYNELCEAYGEPDVIRREEINPNFLEARLVTTEFHYEGASDEGKKTRITKIPKSFDIYAVKGIVGKMYGLAPLKLRLIWETGEWDPVAGYDEQDGDDDIDDEDDALVETNLDSQEAGGEDDKAGRWVKREVELTDGPKQLGYCVDGLRARIRVEASRSS